MGVVQSNTDSFAFITIKEDKEVITDTTEKAMSSIFGFKKRKRYKMLAERMVLERIDDVSSKSKNEHLNCIEQRLDTLEKKMDLIIELLMSLRHK